MISKDLLSMGGLTSTQKVAIRTKTNSIAVFESVGGPDKGAV